MSSAHIQRAHSVHFVSLSIIVAVSLMIWVLGGSASRAVTTVSTLSQQQKLTAADGVAGDFFGGAVAISGDTAIVDASPAGAVYVFVRANGGPWTLQQK